MRAVMLRLWLIMMLGSVLLTSCLLPGMIPLNPEPAQPTQPAESEQPAGDMPAMETDSEAVLETLREGKWVYLQALAKEQHSQEEYDKPGTRTFTVTITDDTPTYFNYGWCTTTEEILQQNFEHIRVRLSFDGQALGSDVVHPIQSTRSNGFVCLEFGVLISDWPPGKYELEARATFDEPINDGAADFAAGDYVYLYNVTVEQ